MSGSGIAAAGPAVARAAVKDSSGCRPVASHCWDLQRSGSRSKGETLAKPSEKSFPGLGNGVSRVSGREDRRLREARAGAGTEDRSGTKRLDRSGRGAINPFDVHAVEEALKIKEAQGGEVVIVTMGPAAAQDSVRKALAMGADEALLITDEAAEGRPRRDHQRAGRGAPRRRRRPDRLRSAVERSTAPCSGLLSPTGTTASVISQVAELEVSDGKVRGKRQTEFGYDTIEAPTPAVRGVRRDQRASVSVAQGDHGRALQAAAHRVRLGAGRAGRRRGRDRRRPSRRSVIRRRAATP